MPVTKNWKSNPDIFQDSGCGRILVGLHEVQPVNSRDKIQVEIVDESRKRRINSGNRRQKTKFEEIKSV